MHISAAVLKKICWRHHPVHWHELKSDNDQILQLLGRSRDTTPALHYIIHSHENNLKLLLGARSLPATM